MLSSSLTPLLIYRFMLNLRQVSEAKANGDIAGGFGSGDSDFTANSIAFAKPPSGRITGNLGEELDGFFFSLDSGQEDHLSVATLDGGRAQDHNTEGDVEVADKVGREIYREMNSY